MTATHKLTKGVRVFLSDITQGFFEITHNGFALLGLAVMFAVITLSTRPEIRQAGEIQLIGWLQTRQAAAIGIPGDADAIDRATATNPQSLPKQQAAVAYWLSKKYNIAPEPLSALVAEAYETGARTRLDHINPGGRGDEKIELPRFTAIAIGLGVMPHGARWRRAIGAIGKSTGLRMRSG